MFDELLRPVKETLLGPVARVFGRMPPTLLSLLGLLLGLACAALLATQQYALGFLFWFLNRLFDGIDGMVARASGRQTDFGGYLDIVIDFVVYAAIPIGLVLGLPQQLNWMALAFLLAAFYVNAASWIYLSALLEKRQAGARASGEQTSVTMPRGVVGGGETILFYTVFMLFPSRLALWFVVMGSLTLLGVGQRLWWARRRL